MKRLLAYVAAAILAAGFWAWMLIAAVVEMFRAPDSSVRDWLTWPGVND